MLLKITTKQIGLENVTEIISLVCLSNLERDTTQPMKFISHKQNMDFEDRILFYKFYSFLFPLTYYFVFVFVLLCDISFELRSFV